MTGKLITFIEDEPDIQDIVAYNLRREGYQVSSALSGEDGLSLVKQKLPDLILLDLMLPGMDGLEVCRHLRTQAETRDIPIIMVTAKGEESDVVLGLGLGADDYITKPFEEEELISAVESRLAKAEIVSKASQNKTIHNNQNGDSILKNLNQLKNFFDENGVVSSFNKGDLIYEEGERSNKIYLILEGVVKSYKMDGNGKELITALYKADDFLGFTSFAESIIYQESVMAVENVQVAGISKNELKEIIGNNKEVSVEILNLLTDNISYIKEQLLQMAYGSVRKKTAKTILQFAKILDKKPEDAIKISRYDLASVAGIATESLIRTLSGFKKNGLIEIEGRNIRILDLEKLNAIE
jgi:CheY-like chemotaxis protein